MNPAPRILVDQQAERRLAAQRALTSSCLPPEEDARSTSRKRWPVEQPADALDAACHAGFCHFIHDKDPARADRRYANLSPRAKASRIEEFLVMARAFVAAGGRI